MRIIRWRPRAVTAARLAAVPLGLLGLVAAVPGAAANPATTSAPRLSPPVPRNFDVSQWPGTDAENTIAANPTDPQNVVAMDCVLGRKALKGLFIGVSFDGGRTWQRRLFSRGPQPCDERLAWDRYGNLWLAHLTNLVKGDVFVWLSIDGGRRFTRAADLTHPPGNGSDQPFIATGPGSVWVSYADAASGVIHAAGARVTGRGRFGPFSRPQSVPTRQGQGDASGLAIGPHGQVVVIYENIAGPRRSRIYTALDPDGLGPRGFGRPRLLARTRVNYADFIPAQPDRGIDAEPKLAWDTGPGRYHGRLYAVWTQAAARNKGNLNTMFQYSGNAGRTWTRPVRLSDAQTAGSQFFQSIAVDQASGNIAAGWYDCRNAHGQGGHGCGRQDSYAQFWATYSTDGGRRFAPDFRVSRGTSNAKDSRSGFDYGDYTQVAFEDHLFYPAWSDNSGSTGTNPDGKLHQVDLYAARIRVR